MLTISCDADFERWTARRGATFSRGRAQLRQVRATSFYRNHLTQDLLCLGFSRRRRGRGVPRELLEQPLEECKEHIYPISDQESNGKRRGGGSLCDIEQSYDATTDARDEKAGGIGLGRHERPGAHLMLEVAEKIGTGPQQRVKHG